MTPTTTNEFTIEHLSPSSLMAHPLNWGYHSERQTQALEKSIEEHGWLAAPIVNRRTGRLLDGHARVEYARARGEGTIPVRVVDVDEAQERKILLVFDRISEMRGRDDANLMALFQQAMADDGDLPTGWDKIDMENLAAVLTEKGEEWDTDMERVERMEESEEGLQAKITVSCSQDMLTDVRERVEFAVDGIEGVTVR